MINKEDLLWMLENATEIKVTVPYRGRKATDNVDEHLMSVRIDPYLIKEAVKELKGDE